MNDLESIYSIIDKRLREFNEIQEVGLILAILSYRTFDGFLMRTYHNSNKVKLYYKTEYLFLNSLEQDFEISPEFEKRVKELNTTIITRFQAPLDELLTHMSLIVTPKYEIFTGYSESYLGMYNPHLEIGVVRGAVIPGRFEQKKMETTKFTGEYYDTISGV